MFDDNVCMDKIRLIQACDNNILVFKLTDESIVIKQWKNKSRSESWTPEKRELARQREIQRSGENK